MLQPLKLIDQLRARLRETLDLLPLDANQGWVSLILELPQPLAMAPDLREVGFYLGHAQRGEFYAGYGIAAQWQAEGPGRLERLRQVALTWSKDWVQIDPDETGLVAQGLLGFAATPRPREGEDLPNTLLWLPELALIRRQDRCALILTASRPITRAALLHRWEGWIARLAPRLGVGTPLPLPASVLNPLRSQPDFSDWSRLVLAAIDDIANSRLEKVVICRRQAVRGQRPFDLERLRAVLSESYPSCQVIHIRYAGSDFIAATPERLFRQWGDRVEADAIAGTACRAQDQMQDAAIRQALLACPKNRHEHQVVVDAMHAALAPCCRALEEAAGPQILALNNAYHLQTRLRGLLRPGIDAFALAEHLHPTPATNGQPRAAAADWLRTHEPFARGWYTGAAGLIAPDLSGELWVLLRCSRIQGQEAELYAGAGIVAGSEPESEWQETEHKLAAMSKALRFA
ncbi:isochorismate synthase [Caldichromatium japonicum]|uniref:isochorismate synthase n=1 Tax=Caldichromatium japonicum TaxID=2699430 RepID=A0A6G7VCT8_9GAMM|nr:isochorismate synthase [Caldichromatium japonicum]QIK37695.1 isochorismate synthase [Caldichromatium japonicum]